MLQNKYINDSQCKTCGGHCCKKGSGTYMPEDILKISKITQELILNLLETGNYAIDFVEENIKGSIDGYLYFLRPRHKDGSVIIPYSKWGGACIYHTKKGCSLPREERPTSCNLLIPSIKNGRFFCTYDENDMVGKRHGSEKWIPYNKILYRAKNVYLENHYQENKQLI